MALLPEQEAISRASQGSMMAGQKNEPNPRIKLSPGASIEGLDFLNKSDARLAPMGKVKPPLGLAARSGAVGAAALAGGAIGYGIHKSLPESVNDAIGSGISRVIGGVTDEQRAALTKQDDDIEQNSIWANGAATPVAQAPHVNTDAENAALSSKTNIAQQVGAKIDAGKKPYEVDAAEQANIGKDTPTSTGYDLNMGGEQSSSISKVVTPDANGGKQTAYYGIGRTKTPEQEAFAAARLAQGNEMRGRMGLGAIGADGRAAVASQANIPEELRTDGSFDPSQPGGAAGAMYMLGAAKQRVAIEQNARQQGIAQQNANSENQVRGLGVRAGQAKLDQDTKVGELRSKLASASPEERNAITQQIYDLTGHTTAQEDMANMAGAKTLSASMNPSDQDIGNAYIAQSLQRSVNSKPQANTVVAPPKNHIDALKQNPSMAAQFDARYGAGSAQKVLGK